jgi:outer membrane protein assembly factor BamD (BamD/ComL family)
MDLLVTKREDAQSGDEIHKLEQAIASVERAEEKYIEEKIASLSMREETLESTRKLLDNEQLEEAISNLNALEAQEEDNLEIRELKEQAIERLINRERNRAAKLFLAARGTQDPVKKEEFLRSSYEILNELVDKYPSSPLNKKLKNHIAKVREELEKL